MKNRNELAKIVRKSTRTITIRDLKIGANAPIAVQSMCATKTQDTVATVEQISQLHDKGAQIIRVAVDSKKDVESLAIIRKQVPQAILAVDIQESYRLIPSLAPYVDKIRYNPGHLHHHEKELSVFQKVKDIVAVAKTHQLALRIGVNFGSIDPSQPDRRQSPIEAALSSASEHVGFLEELGFHNYLVSLKSSNPNDVVEINRRFSAKHPEVPLHLGVTEAGMLPMGEVKSRAAFEPLLAEGIGDTLRVSLTLPSASKYLEVVIGQKIIADVYSGKAKTFTPFKVKGLNLISCPSCSRVENEAFIDLAEKVREISSFAASEDITIAVMGCRVNGPGETDDADLGLWCAPNYVNLKRKEQLIGHYSYDQVLAVVRSELQKIIKEKNALSNQL